MDVLTGEVLKILKGYEYIDRNILPKLKDSRSTRGREVAFLFLPCRLAYDTLVVLSVDDRLIEQISC